MKRKVAGLFVLLVVLIGMTACGSDQGGSQPSSSSPAAETVASAFAPSASEKPTLETTKLKIGSSRDPQLGAVLIVASERGFFQEEGLEVTLELFPTGSDLATAISGKSILVGSVSDSTASILRATKNPVKVIARQADISGVQSLVVKPEIKHPKDLEGKKIAISSGNTSEALFLKIVDHYRLDVNAIELFRMAPGEMLAAFIRGDIDGYVIWEPNVLMGVRKGGVRLVSASESFVVGEEGPQSLLGAYSLLIADSAFLEENPETTKAILRALNKAAAFIAAQPQDSIADVAKVLKIDPADTEVMMKLNKYSLDITPELVNNVRDTATFLKSLGKIPAVPNDAEMYNTSFLKELDPSRVTWEPSK